MKLPALVLLAAFAAGMAGCCRRAAAPQFAERSLDTVVRCGAVPCDLSYRFLTIPNADRSGNAMMQAQTFYFSNMTPQNYSLNQNPWAALEKMARDNWMCSDTLYVVTGAYWNPGSTFATPDIDGKQCPVPNYYFKVFVRTVKGNVRQAGDRLGDYPADQLKSIGFWVENAGGQGTARSWVKSVSEVENLTGFEFFPSVPAAVKAQKDAASWGL